MRGAAVALAALALAACAAPTATTPPPAAASTAVEAPATAAVPIAPPRRMLPADLIGRSERQLADLLGAPRLLRREPPAEVWQYSGPACSLLVVFYPDPADRTALRAQHISALPTAQGRAVEPGDCLESLLRGRPAVS